MDDEKVTCDVCGSNQFTYYNIMRERIICCNPDCPKDSAITLEQWEAGER